MNIPTLCIHLRTPEERESFKVNKEDHLVPILCEEVGNSLSPAFSTANATAEAKDTWASSQSSELIEVLAAELSCDASDIVDFDLSLYDTQKASIGGTRQEFLSSSRLDNLASCFIALEALTDHAAESLEDDEDVSLIALFDHEEVGSDSYQGAGSTLMRDAVVRVNDAMAASSSDSETFRRAVARSFVLSVDMAHAIHPNYASKHEANHAPKLNGGIVIKSNSNQRYATNTATAFIVRELAKRVEAPIQNFVVRNDCPCGSTIGPM
jgi:aspartyl aminopeptidase